MCVCVAQALNSSVRGVKLSDECHVSPLVARMLDVLTTVEGWVNEYPPSVQQMRYGNVSFRAWHQRLVSSSEGAMIKFEKFVGSV